MCAQGRPDESHGVRIFAGEVADAYLQRDDIQRGYTIVDLARAARRRADRARAGRGGRLLARGAARRPRHRARTSAPVKMNYDILGNSLPHLHTHVIPRYADDPRPGWPFPSPETRRRRGSSADVDALRAARRARSRARAHCASSSAWRSVDPLSVFSERTRDWFEHAFAAPTPAQERGWPAIASRRAHAHPGADRARARRWPRSSRARPARRASRARASGCSTSRRSRRSTTTSSATCAAPLAGLAARELPASASAPATRRSASAPQMLRAPARHPDHDARVALPLLTSQARETLRGVETLIVDEVHAVAGTKRGAHLALTLERLERARSRSPSSASACRRRSARSTRSAASSAAAPVELVDAGRARSSTSRSSCPSRTCASCRPTGRSYRSRPTGRRWTRAPSATASRSGRRSTRRCSSWSARTARRRLRQQPPARRAARAAAERARPRRSSRAPTTARSRASSGVEIEELLKRGELPCLVATSSLELGIDMGAVDLVIQVERRSRSRAACSASAAPATSSAPSRAAASSRSTAATCSRRRSSRGACSTARSRRRVIPRNPLDVLAQQIVAICADDEIAVDELHDARPPRLPLRRPLARAARDVLDMLAGRYPSDEFAELRPRIVWDRTGGVIRGRHGARRLAVTNAGTIPDRGLFGVFLADGGGRVGELDEEMVYEARAGQTFLLGASTWRIEEITRDRVLVTPAPGEPGQDAVLARRGRRAGRSSSARRSARPRASSSRCPRRRRSPACRTSTRSTSAPPATC